MIDLYLTPPITSKCFILSANQQYVVSPGKTTRGGISFWVWQDGYHMGQTGFILTTLGLTDIKKLYHKKKESLQTNE